LASRLLLLNGPNLNLLGQREPDVYGHETLDDITARLHHQLPAQASLTTLQSNAEHVLIDAVQQASGDGASGDGVDFIIINPGAFTHTSIALRDALLGVGIPFIEVHLSNVHTREAFRRTSYLSDIAEGVIVGFGARGYELAIQAALQQLDANADAEA